MTIRLYNTLTKKVDEFVPISEKKALLYTCGPTVYDYATVGNWSGYIYWDVLVRLLSFSGYDVVRVMNITDVGHLTSDADEGEDKLEKGARREGKTASEIAKFYTDNFLEGMDKLNLVAPQYITKATEYINEQLELIRKLKQKGFTYQINDGIYFDTSKFPSYADFANLDLESQKAGARVTYNSEKKNSSDFALWKFSPIDSKRDMEWETPKDILEYIDENTEDSKSTKMGFPGWAIECSAMAIAKLGETIDIHTGGIDHIPVHHTNEIAQSEAATGKKFSNFWLHNNHLKVNGTKISKSLNNGYTLQDLEARGFSESDFRMFILQSNYKNEGNFTFENLEAAKNRLKNWTNVSLMRHQTHDTLISDEEKSTSDKTESLYSACQALLLAIGDDLNTPEALKIIDDVFTRIVESKLLDIDRRSLVQFIETIDSLLGLDIMNNSPDIKEEFKKMIIERNRERSQKNWVKSDEIRNTLLDSGIVLRDIKDYSIWEYAK